jgi:hypothetical protein
VAAGAAVVGVVFFVETVVHNTVAVINESVTRFWLRPNSALTWTPCAV